MRIRYESGGSVQHFDVAGAIENRLREADYYAGEIETIRSEVRNQSVMMGKLVEMLLVRALNPEDVLELLGYGYSNADEPSKDDAA